MTGIAAPALPPVRWASLCIDCADAEELAAFYSRLLGWDIAARDGREPGGPAEWIALRDPAGGVDLLFQAETWYRPPVWPEEPGAQDKMLHLEIEAADLDAAVAHAVASGARVASHQPADRDPDELQVMLDPDAVRHWMVPEGMTSRIHAFDGRPGGTFRISLTYDRPTTTGKTDAQTDTFHGRFVRLVPDAEVVQVVEFETDDPDLQGEMTITYTLADAGDGTDLVGVHEHLPPGVPPADNEVGWSMSIDKLARLVEGDPADP